MYWQFHVWPFNKCPIQPLGTPHPAREAANWGLGPTNTYLQDLEQGRGEDMCNLCTLTLLPLSVHMCPANEVYMATLYIIWQLAVQPSYLVLTIVNSAPGVHFAVGVEGVWVGYLANNVTIKPTSGC